MHHSVASETGFSGRAPDIAAAWWLSTWTVHAVNDKTRLSQLELPEPEGYVSSENNLQDELSAELRLDEVSIVSAREVAILGLEALDSTGIVNGGLG